MDTPPEDLSDQKMPRTGLLVALVVIIGLVVWSSVEREPRPDGQSGLEAHAPTQNRYVGSRVCAGCHQQIAADYAQHPMARSLQLVGTTEVIEDFAADRRQFTGGRRT